LFPNHETARFYGVELSGILDLSVFQVADAGKPTRLSEHPEVTDDQFSGTMLLTAYVMLNLGVKRVPSREGR
jgi:hypothetical protein